VRRVRCRRGSALWLAAGTTRCGIESRLDGGGRGRGGAAPLFFWFWRCFLTKPSGRRAFGLTPEFAEKSRALAANQGLYNGFLAAGLIWGLYAGAEGYPVKVFFLGCVIVAAIRGGDGEPENPLGCKRCRVRWRWPWCARRGEAGAWKREGASERGERTRNPEGDGGRIFIATKNTKGQLLRTDPPVRL